MKKKCFLFLGILLSTLSFGQTTLLQESFETDGNGTRYTTSVQEFSDGISDFFTNTLNNTITGGYNINGIDGNHFFTAMDTNGDGGPNTVTLDFNDINISAFTNLTFAMLVGEDAASDGEQDWDDITSLIVEVDIDNSGLFTKILQFEAVALRPDGTASTSNKQPALDTDFDGVGDSTLVTDTMQEFTASIASGNLLDIRITFTNFINGDEDIAIDNIRVVDGFTASPNITLGSSVSDLNYVEGSGPSSEGTFTVEGTDLIGDITVTAPTDFEVSLTSGAGFGNSVTLQQSGGSVVSTTVYARLAAGLTTSTYNGDVTATSTGAIDKTLNLSGEVFAALNCPTAGDLVINEIMRNPDASGNDPAGEYFEIYNTTGSPIDMNGWIIRDNGSDTHTITTSLVVPANGYIVLGHQSTTTPTLDYSYGTEMALSNTSDEVVIQCSGTVIDDVVYDSSFPITVGASMELAINAQNSLDNDNSANWGAATNDIGNTDLGTPGSANDFTLSNNLFEVTSFSLYPNPTIAGGEIHIVSSSNLDINISVYDILSKQVKSETLSNNTMSVAELKKGIYIIRLSQGEATSTKKLVIK